MARFNPNAYGNPVAQAQNLKNATPGLSASADLPKQLVRVTDPTKSSAVTITQHGEDTQSTITTNQDKEDHSPLLKALSGRLSDSKFAVKTTGSSDDNPAQFMQPNMLTRSAGVTDTASEHANGSHNAATLQTFSSLNSSPFDTNTEYQPKSVPDKTAVPIPDTQLQDSMLSINQKEADSTTVSTTQIIVQPSNPDIQVIPLHHINQNHRKPATKPDLHSTPELTMEERLNEARGNSLKGIQLRIKAKDKRATTSLRDLQLARTPTRNSKSNELADSASYPGMPLSVESNTPLNQQPERAPSVGRQQRSRGHAVRGRHQPSLRSHRVDNRRKSAPGNVHPPSDTTNIKMTDCASRMNLKPIEMDANSNTGHSPDLSNVSQASNDSVQKLHAGKAMVAQSSQRPHPLAAWDGGFQPAPADWNDRPRFNNDSSEFRSDFARWNHDVCQMLVEDSDNRFRPIPPRYLEDLNANPDGISMVSIHTTVNINNASHYGYSKDETQEVMKYAQRVGPKDFEDWGKMDLSKAENVAIKDETTNDLVSNWMKQTEERRRVADADFERQLQSAQALFDYKASPNPHRPILNIYLRPACSTDIPGMVQIYNWHIQNSARPAETSQIEEEDMHERLEDVRSGKLPFIVAIMKNLGEALPYDLEAEAEAFSNDPHPIKNIDPMHRPVTASEKVVGWACAQDFTAADFVERISVEMEVYVDPACRQMGVGRCLMDKLIESCDRGYMKKGGYPFHCPQEERHLYSSGGGRDLHKLIFIVRKWKFPQKQAVAQSVTPKVAKVDLKRRPDDQEDDYNLWLRAWLESWDFEVEGVLKGAGAKDGRFIDVVHFGRETRWQPSEGRIPNPKPGLY